MDQSFCLSNPKTTIPGGSKALYDVSATSPDIVTSPNGNATRSLVSQSTYPSIRIHLTKTRKLTCRSILRLSVAATALLIVWGSLLTITIFFAFPGRSQNSLNDSGMTNMSTEKEVGSNTQVNRTCYRLTRWDPLKNSCYVPCEEWEWRTNWEQKFRLATTSITSAACIICIILMTVTWIKLRHL
jgi:hypothetical protein